MRHPAGMEQIAIEVMRFTMIAQIQSYDLVPAIKHLLCQGKDVQRLRTTLPPMQYDYGTSGAVPRTRPEALQTYPITAVEHYFLFSCHHPRRTPGDRTAAR